MSAPLFRIAPNQLFTMRKIGGPPDREAGFRCPAASSLTATAAFMLFLWKSLAKLANKSAETLLNG
jgi:hypothetical protein